MTPLFWRALSVVLLVAAFFAMFAGEVFASWVCGFFALIAILILGGKERRARHEARP